VCDDQEREEKRIEEKRRENRVREEPGFPAGRDQEEGGGGVRRYGVEEARVAFVVEAAEGGVGEGGVPHEPHLVEMPCA
jgi:hypothetical protein